MLRECAEAAGPPRRGWRPFQPLPRTQRLGFRRLREIALQNGELGFSRTRTLAPPLPSHTPFAWDGGSKINVVFANVCPHNLGILPIIQICDQARGVFIQEGDARGVGWNIRHREAGGEADLLPWINRGVWLRRLVNGHIRVRVFVLLQLCVVCPVCGP